ncbi:ketopantoate reductase family protein [Halalkalicoccus ordinarius]|uniref:ketopantoate reductase family protein n=1 Tax=Halalkalicoccus ordinarius TaxID=3116651 RepID=UPI00300E9B6E
MEIVVFGAGSLGSLIGGLLAREHDVILVGRDPHVSAVHEEGLRVSGEYEFRVHPRATTDGVGLAGDLAVVTVKSFDTPEAARTLATGSFDAVLSLQNGLGNERVLAERLDRVLAGTVTYGARLRPPGHVACTGQGEITIGPSDGGESPLAERLAAAFRAADVNATAVEDAPRRLWEKLAINAGINPVTALARVRNGALADGPARETACGATRETARVARAEGVRLTDREALAALESVIDATGENRSSMLQDVEAGRRTEVGAINGAVVRHATERGIDAPTNRHLRRLIRAWERGRSGRDGGYGDHNGR